MIMVALGLAVLLQAAEPQAPTFVAPADIGVLTTTSFGPGAIRTVTWQAIDMRSYVESAGTRIVQAELPENVSFDPVRIGSDAWPLGLRSGDNVWTRWPPEWFAAAEAVQGDQRRDANREPRLLQKPPVAAPAPGGLGCAIGTVELRQYFAAGSWQQIVTYYRSVHQDARGCRNGRWSIPQLVQRPVVD